MSMPVWQIRKWLNSLDDNDRVGIGEDCMSLELVGDSEVYLEVGALPLEEEATQEGER